MLIDLVGGSILVFLSFSLFSSLPVLFSCRDYSDPGNLIPEPPIFGLQLPTQPYPEELISWRSQGNSFLGLNPPSDPFISTAGFQGLSLCKIPHAATSLGLRGGDGGIGHLIWVAGRVLV
jgi:hypothetical protein